MHMEDMSPREMRTGSGMIAAVNLFLECFQILFLFKEGFLQLPVLFCRADTAALRIKRFCDRKAFLHVAAGIFLTLRAVPDPSGCTAAGNMVPAPVFGPASCTGDFRV